MRKSTDDVKKKYQIKKILTKSLEKKADEKDDIQ